MTPTLQDIREAFQQIEDLLATGHPGKRRMAQHIAAGMVEDLGEEEAQAARDEMAHRVRIGHMPSCLCPMCEYGRVGGEA